MYSQANPRDLAANAARKFLEFSQSLSQTRISPTLHHLVDLRVSQINGCAFCVDMHVKQAKIAGERELRLHHLAVWRESPHFSDEERAALAWAERLTLLASEGVSLEDFDSAAAVLGEETLSDLTFAVMAINGWNRMCVGFGIEPGSQDVAFGLTKAGLN